jgi:hypothetical protein
MLQLILITQYCVVNSLRQPVPYCAPLDVNSCLVEKPGKIVDFLIKFEFILFDHSLIYC